MCVARKPGHAHHILFHKRLHEANKDNSELRTRSGLIVRLDVDAHDELHRHCPGVPPLDIYMARRVKSIIVPSTDPLEAVDNFCYAVEEASKSPKSHAIERGLGQLSIEAVRIQVPFIQEGFIDLQH